MYREIKEYFSSRGQLELLNECVEKIHHTDNGVELFCGSNSGIVAEIASIIEEGICDGALKEAGAVSIEGGKGLTTWICISKTEEIQERLEDEYKKIVGGNKQ